MANIWVNGEEIATLKTLLQNKSFDNINDLFDLNTPFTGFRMFEKKPKNAPDNCADMGIVASFQLNPDFLTGDIIQIIFDFQGRFMYRTHNGYSGHWAWSNWKQIGGVTSLPIYRYVISNRMEVA